MDESAGWRKWATCWKKMTHLDENQFLRIHRSSAWNTCRFLNWLEMLQGFVPYWSLRYCCVLFGHTTAKSNELIQLGTKSKVFKLNCGTWSSKKHDNWKFAQIKRGWPIAKSIRNTIPMLMAVSFLNLWEWAPRPLLMNRPTCPMIFWILFMECATGTSHTTERRGPDLKLHRFRDVQESPHYAQAIVFLQPHTPGSLASL